MDETESLLHPYFKDNNWNIIIIAQKVSINNKNPATGLMCKIFAERLMFK